MDWLYVWQKDFHYPQVGTRCIVRWGCVERNAIYACHPPTHVGDRPIYHWHECYDTTWQENGAWLTNISAWREGDNHVAQYPRNEPAT